MDALADGKQSTMRRLYHTLSLVALVVLFALAGFGGFLFATGRLNSERMDQIARVLRGEWPAAAAGATTQPTTQSQPSTPVQASREEIARMQAQKEFFELANERSRREVEQRRSLNQQIQLDVTRQLEEIEAKRREILEEKKRMAQQAGTGGLSQELEVFSAMEPRKAKELLMQRKEPDVVGLIRRMDTNRVKKLVEACKTTEEMAWIGRILTQIHDMDPQTAPGVDGPGAASK